MRSTHLAVFAPLGGIEPVTADVCDVGLRGAMEDEPDLVVGVEGGRVRGGGVGGG